MKQKEIGNEDLVNKYKETKIKFKTRAQKRMMTYSSKIREKTFKGGIKILLIIILILSYFAKQVVTQKSGPNLGKLYDCSQFQEVGLFALYDTMTCNDEMKGVKKFQATVWKYRQLVQQINMWWCTKYRVTLECKENLLGVDHKRRERMELFVTKEECHKAVRFKTTDYGRLEKTGYHTWEINNNEKFNCRWLQKEKNTYIEFKVTTFNGKIIDREHEIQQTITDTKCDFLNYLCRPAEKSKSVLVWKKEKLKGKLYKSLGVLEIHKIHKFIVIPKLSIGGAILKQDTNEILLDTGYIINKIKHQNVSTIEFDNYSKKYVKMTKSSTQRDILAAQIGLELIHLEKSLEGMAKLLCQQQNRVTELKNFMLYHFSELGHDLFPGTNGMFFKLIGDALAMYRCKIITDYQIHWSHKLNGTCFELPPVTSVNYKGVRYLSMRNRRLLEKSRKYNCSKKDLRTIIRAVDGKFWEFSKSKFKTIKINKYTHDRKVNLPKLHVEPEILMHYKKAAQHRTTMMEILGEQTDNFEKFEQFKDEGNGDILLGITKGVTKIFRGVSTVGHEIFHEIGTTLVDGIKVAGNITDEVIEVGTKGITEILAQFGIPNVIILGVNACIILYLLLLRFQVKRLNFLFPPALRHSEYLTGDDLHKAISQISRDTYKEDINSTRDEK